MLNKFAGSKVCVSVLSANSLQDFFFRFVGYLCKYYEYLLEASLESCAGRHDK